MRAVADYLTVSTEHGILQADRVDIQFSVTSMDTPPWWFTLPAGAANCQSNVVTVLFQQGRFETKLTGCKEFKECCSRHCRRRKPSSTK
jgi:hypothetical protein